MYFGYYLKQLDKPKFKLFLQHAKKESGRSTLALLWDILLSSLRYNISILEYFQFHFYKISSQEKAAWAGTGYMYEYQLKMNPKEGRSVLEDKLQFLAAYKDFVHHAYASLNEIKTNSVPLEELLKNQSGKIVFKHSHGQCGNGIEVLPTQGFDQAKIIAQLEKGGNDFVEEFVSQHPQLMKMSPAGLNTVRVVTQITTTNKVDLVAARLRITVNSSVDNLAAGNIAAPIDIHTGLVCGKGVYSDITKPAEQFHPITKTEIPGFAIPYWEEITKMITAAALLYPSNRSVGWDVAVTERGPELIEGNHDWCKLLWQLPAQKGLKADLEKYLK